MIENIKKLTYLVEVMFWSSARESPPSGGYHGQVDLGELQTSCIWIPLEGDGSIFSFDKWMQANLQPMFPEHVKHLFEIGVEYSVTEGNLVVGKVKILKEYDELSV